MDPTLAKIYGTNQTSDAADVEKLAAAHMAEELANESGIDVNDLSPEQIEAMAQEVLDGVQAQGDEQDTSANADGNSNQEDPDAETLAKVAEADKLGRVMAHAYHQELRSIEKSASASQAVKNWAQLGGHAGGKVMSAVKSMGAKGKSVASKAGEKAKEVGKKGVEHVKKHKGAYGAGAAAAGGGAAGYMAGKHKKSSALDTLAEQHALEILAANGIDPATLELQQEKVSEADPAEVLSNAVEARAWELLSQYGIVPAETEQK